MKNVVQRNRCLYDSAERGFTYTQVCQELENRFLEKVTYQEWLLWRDFYYPMTHNHTFFKNEIINNNKTLSWLIRKLAERNTKACLS